ncbi:unnamed protein product [Prunus armeniaca]
MSTFSQSSHSRRPLKATSWNCPPQCVHSTFVNHVIPQGLGFDNAAQMMEGEDSGKKNLRKWSQKSWESRLGGVGRKMMKGPS